MKDTLIIKCPKCGKEYLPSEIYYPNSFLGKPTSIVKNDEGKIVFYLGDSMDLQEEYECSCGCHFTTKASIEFTVEENTSLDFSEEEYTTPLFGNRIALQEPEEAKVYELFGREEVQ